MPRLRAITPLTGIEALDLPDGASTLGRDPGAELAIQHSSLSRRHAVFTCALGQVSVADLGSKNGTWLNGLLIEGEVAMRVGERVRVGTLEFELEAHPDDPAASPQPTGSSRWSTGQEQPIATLVDLALDGAETGRLQLMLRVAEELARPMEVADLLHRVLELSSQILNADRLVLLRQTESGLVPVAAFEAGNRVSATRTWSRAIVQMVIDNRAALRFPDTRADPRLTGASSIGDQDIRCAMGAPLLKDHELLGVVYVDNLAQTRAFTELDLQLLSGVTNQAALALHHAQLREEREQQAVFANNLLRFFPPATVRRLLERDLLDLEPMEADVTVLFCDIANFTGITSQLSPTRVLELLNTYFPPLVAAVHDHEGTVEKYIGDALMAVWGAPFPHPEGADSAMRAAVAMRKALAGINRSLEASGLPPVEVYIGLHSGPIAFGNLGTDAYLQFATVGDTTNVAARVCDAARPGQILLTEATRRRLENTVDMVRVADAVLKGKSSPTALYEACPPSDS